MFKTRSFDRIIRLSPRESAKNVLSSRLQNSQLFLKISKEIGKAWRESLKREARASHARKACEAPRKNLALVFLLCEM